MKKGKNPKVSDTKLAHEWAYNKNILKPHEVTTGSDKTVWWHCATCELDYDAVVHTRFRNNAAGCPFCALKRASYFHNLKIKFPKTAKFFLKEKNKVASSEVTPQSRKLYWWKCENGHEFESSCMNMTRHGDGARCCAYCKGNKVWPGESVADVFPHLLEELNLEKENKDILFEYSPYSAKKINWKCKLGHEWLAPIQSRSTGRGCKKCSNPYTKPELRIFTELAVIFPDAKLRARVHEHEIDILLSELSVGVEYDGLVWHEKRYKQDKEKNEALEKHGISIIRVRDRLSKIGDNDIVFDGKFTLDVVSAVFQEVKKLHNSAHINRLIDRYIKIGRYQNDELYRKIISELPAPRFEDSFEGRFPKKAMTWDFKKNHPITPRLISYGSAQSYWWVCGEKGHSFSYKPYHYGKESAGCPYCSSKRIDKTNSLRAAFPHLAAEWDFNKNKDKTPDTVAPNHNKKVWWLCPKGHSYFARCNTRVNTGSGCPICSGRLPKDGESVVDLYPELATYLKEEMPNPQKLNHLKPGSHLAVGIKCRDCNIIIKKEIRQWVQQFNLNGIKVCKCKNCR